MSYKDHLARKGLEPLHIHRTVKRGGDLILGNAVMPLRVAPGGKGRFAGYVK